MKNTENMETENHPASYVQMCTAGLLWFSHGGGEAVFDPSLSRSFSLQEESTAGSSHGGVVSESVKMDPLIQASL